MTVSWSPSWVINHAWQNFNRTHGATTDPKKDWIEREAQQNGAGHFVETTSRSQRKSSKWEDIVVAML